MTIDAAGFVTLSKRFREGLQHYRLMPTDVWLAQQMCLETFDEGKAGGRVDLEGWARKGAMRDAKGLRCDKCEKVVQRLSELGIVDVNFVQGTFELRACPEDWSRMLARRSPARSKAEDELPLRDERPLSEALSDNSRDKALESGPVPKKGWSALFTEWKIAFQAGPEALAEFYRQNPEAETASAEKSADIPPTVRRINPPTHYGSSPDSVTTPVPQGFAAGAGVSAEKSADSLAPKASSACTGTKAQLATARSAEKSAAGESSAEKAEWTAKAKAWLELVDENGALKGIYGPQWLELCERDPRYVLNRLRGAFEDHQRRLQRGEEDLKPITNPLAWLSRKARDEGRMKRG